MNFEVALVRTIVLIITLSKFTADAMREAEEVDRSPISLIDGAKLIDLMIEQEIGVVRKSTEVLQLDEASLSSEVTEGPEELESAESAPRRIPRRLARTTKNLSVWPLPGGAIHWKSTLDAMLRYIAVEAPTTTDAATWLISSFERVNSEKVVRGYWQVLRSFGLVESEGEQLVLTGDGSTYLEDPTDDRLLGQMRQQIAGTDELIERLGDGPASLSELRQYLNEKLGTEWETDAQVRFRLGWLSVLGAVELKSEGARLIAKPTSPLGD